MVKETNFEPGQKEGRSKVRVFSFESQANGTCDTWKNCRERKIERWHRLFFFLFRLKTLKKKQMKQLGSIDDN